MIRQKNNTGCTTMYAHDDPSAVSGPKLPIGWLALDVLGGHYWWHYSDLTPRTNGEDCQSQLAYVRPSIQLISSQ
jgi:hypothetical protein